VAGAVKNGLRIPRPEFKEQRARGCLSKHPYDTEDEARKDLKVIKKLKKVPGYSTLDV
jgi:hypothetical protein